MLVGLVEDFIAFFIVLLKTISEAICLYKKMKERD